MTFVEYPRQKYMIHQSWISAYVCEQLLICTLFSAMKVAQRHCYKLFLLKPRIINTILELNEIDPGKIKKGGFQVTVKPPNTADGRKLPPINAVRRERKTKWTNKKKQGEDNETGFSAISEGRKDDTTPESGAIYRESMVREVSQFLCRENGAADDRKYYLQQLIEEEAYDHIPHEKWHELLRKGTTVKIESTTRCSICTTLITPLRRWCSLCSSRGGPGQVPAFRLDLANGVFQMLAQRHGGREGGQQLALSHIKRIRRPQTDLERDQVVTVARTRATDGLQLSRWLRFHFHLTQSSLGVEHE